MASVVITGGTEAVKQDISMYIGEPIEIDFQPEQSGDYGDYTILTIGSVENGNPIKEPTSGIGVFSLTDSFFDIFDDKKTLYYNIWSIRGDDLEMRAFGKLSRTATIEPSAGHSVNTAPDAVDRIIKFIVEAA